MERHPQDVLSPAVAWGWLLRELVVDPRVPWHAKVAAGAAIVWSSPVRGLVVHRRLPPGPAGELALIVFASRRLVAAAGYEVVREHWRGDEASFVWLLLLTGIDQ